MKKLLLSLLLACGLLPAFAQVSLRIIYAQHSATTCPTPANANFYVSGETYVYGPSDMIDVFVDYGDGNNNTQSVSNYIGWTQPGWFSASFAHTYSTPGVYTITYIATGPNGDADTTYEGIVISNTCNNITGKLYVDNNSNCSYAAGDQVVASIPVQLISSNVVVATDYTDNNGDYSFSATPGNYEVRVDPTYDLFNYSCTAPSIPFTLATSYIADIPVTNATGIAIQYAGDSMQSYCNAPANVSLMVYGNAMGYNQGDIFTIYINFGDGDDTTITTTAYNNNVPLVGFNYWNMNHTYQSAGNYSVMYVVTGPDNNADTMIVTDDVIVLGICGNLAGTVYTDNNTDCLYNSGDGPVAGLPVYLWQNSTYIGAAYTDLNGQYSFSAPAGTYTVTLSNISNYGYAAACPATGTQTATVTASATTNADFGITCPATSFDLTAGMGGWGFVPNATAYLYPNVNNLSCMPVSGTITLTLDPLTTYTGMCNNSNLPTVTGNVLTWTFTNLSIATNNYWYYWSNILSCVQLHVDTTATVGDTLCFTLSVTPTVGDVNPANNTFTYCAAVRSSWDPNVKDVSPAGINMTHDVAPGTTFDYTIHFQNTGSAPAANIVVRDTLDSDLDLNTFHITGSSHFMQPDVQAGGVLRFYFPNIQLPDSTTDEPASHGWITYSITAKPNLINGTPIENTAYIFFDFNEAVVTNTTLNTINTALSVTEIVAGTADIFPNPAATSFEVRFAQPASGTYYLTDLSGKRVMGGTVNGNSTTIDVSQLPQGMYMLQLDTEQGHSVHKVLIQR